MKFSEFLINEMDGMHQGLQRGKRIMGGGNVNMAATALEKLIKGDPPTSAERNAISGYLEKLKMVMSDPQLDAAFMNLVKRGQRAQGTQQAAQNMQTQARQ